VGSVLTSGVFWPEGGVAETLLWRKMGVLAVDMETAVLYLNAMRAGKRALSILTISDLLEQGVVTSAFERQEACKDMMRVALEAAIRNETHSNE
jgi:purine-nucleoside phosphorylase